MRLLFKNGYFYLLLVVFGGSSWVLDHYYKKASLSNTIAMSVFMIIMISCLFLFTWKVKTPVISVKEPMRETVLFLVYFAVWLIVNLAFWEVFFNKHIFFSNGVSFWVMLVVIPWLMLRRRGYGLSDVGLTTSSLLGNLRAAILSGACFGGIMLFTTPGGKYLLGLKTSAGELTGGLITSLVIAFLFAGFHEEFFFRFILQSRLSQALNSKISGLMVTTLIFSIYHLPFRLFDTSYSGDFVHALAVCFTEGVFGGLILGFLWMRTNHLIAPVFVHSVIDAISGYQAIIEKYHFW
ncbi:CPBP family intramembrane metalloprotease [Paenibacillus donghaensis]|uniref:CPBP family intramembrane glutamic endopeptidase n=1 Tax=Paenibacillus donghaensis TaxID=414771 RepID=UPI0018833057|nr:CPBP family intramembrane glutamic endopeptidase [Paenibacillus donghaensis]MBE9918420.1 CPBP family intramembrane metalloprotease [Paenibacillus donghaensis]